MRVFVKQRNAQDPKQESLRAIQAGGERWGAREAEEALCEKFSCLLKSRSQTGLVISFSGLLGWRVAFCSSPRSSKMFTPFTERTRENKNHRWNLEDGRELGRGQRAHLRDIPFLPAPRIEFYTPFSGPGAPFEGD